jgi:hypothetical protein
MMKVQKESKDEGKGYIEEIERRRLVLGSA